MFADEVRAASANVTTSMINGEGMLFIVPPHFYRRGNLIVLYMGNDPAALSLTEQIIGEQFAGY